MKKIFFLTAILVVLFFIPKIVLGNVVINEIMYNLEGSDDGREWIEVFNNSGAEVDLSGWKFFDGSNHNLNEPPKNGGQGSIKIPVNGYAILADDAIKFLADYPGFSGTVIDTVMSLKNTSATLRIINKEGTEIDSVIYENSWGANGNGRSLQRESPDGNTWGSGIPTPGIINNISPEQPTPGKPIAPSPAGNNAPITDAGDNIIGFVNQEIKFDGTQSSDPDNDELFYSWNMGDGRVIDRPSFSYKYLYPGTYLVTLIVSDGQDYTSDTITVKIQVGQITINEFMANPSGKDEEEEWIEIYNDSDSIVDISDWQLDDIASGSQLFIFPENTLIAPKSYVVFSRQVTKIALNNDKDSVRLLLPEGVVFQEINYENPPLGKSSARTPEGFVWSVPSPGLANVISPLASLDSENKKFVYQQSVKPETTKEPSEDYSWYYQNNSETKIEGGTQLAAIKQISSNQNKQNYLNLFLLIIAIILFGAVIGLSLIRFRKRYS